MRRTTTLSAAVLLGGTLISPIAIATAAGETCRGEAATIVGDAHTWELIGTEGRDVIVTNGGQSVDALGGDDLICVTGTGSPNIDAGADNDVVDTIHSITEAAVVLGTGSDRFEGGGRADSVKAGDVQGLGQHVDTERDVINTGPGVPWRKEDIVTSGQPGVSNADVVTMGSGHLVWAGDPTAEAAVHGGGGSSLGIRAQATETVAIDNVTGTLSIDARPELHFTGFRGFSVAAPEGLHRLTFLGSDRRDELELDVAQVPAGEVDLAGGDDRLLVKTHGPFVDGTSYDAGAGRDEIALVLPDERGLDVNLNRDRFSTGPNQDEVTVPAHSFEDAYLMAHDISVVGTNGKNDVKIHACRSRVRALGGNDRIVAFDQVPEESLPCRRPKARWNGGAGVDGLKGTTGPDRLVGGRDVDNLLGARGADRLVGGRGQDRLRGNAGPDLLLGGRGRDTLIGARGQDRAIGGPRWDLCRAERTRSCEATSRR